MPQIPEKYDRLRLTDLYLADKMLMALAWKKAHDYIRNTNWYADNFELDKSALHLAEHCQAWVNDISSGKLSFEKLKLVPAPKTAHWSFIENTCPKEGDNYLDNPSDGPCYCLKWEPETPDDIKLRPLAHIGIKEQTIMTLVMMCLANDVEALQGDPSTDYDEVHEKKVVSYGNRLYCTYSEDSEGNLTAEHNYGATTIYSKYFTDYRKFLQRPYHFAAKTLPEKSADEEVYLVELDLKQFFDLINRKKLVEKIRGIVQAEQDTPISAKGTAETLLMAFNNWDWSECAKKAYHLCATNTVPKPRKGLPQGLVASGFLSNIYMLEFDTQMSQWIKSGLPETPAKNLTLIDYCRYVDDMRLVITGPARNADNPTPLRNIRNAINTWLEPELKKIGLELNKEKTKVEVYRGKSKGISSALEAMQSNLSGPLSNESADELLTQLESLLMLSDSSKVDQNSEEGECRINRLAAIEKSVFDVREDTLKRFAANKITRILNEKRHFTSRQTDESGNPIAGDWDYLQERIARRLIASWSHDPALVLLLKKGLELFPSPKVLEPVLEQLRDVRLRRCQTSKNIGEAELKQAAVATYCLAEIFRHSAVTIHRKDPQAIPAHADVNSYFDLLQNEAVHVLNDIETDTKPGSDEKSKVSSPANKNNDRPFNLLAEQARFLLLVRLDTTLEESCGDIEQDLIFKLAKGFRNISLEKSITDESIASCILLASQLIDDQKPILRAASCLFDLHVGQISIQNIIEKIATQDSEFVRSLILHARAIKYEWYEANKTGFISTLSDSIYLNVKPSAKPLKDISKPMGIYQISSRDDSPLGNEIMALKLFSALLDAAKESPIGQEDVIDLSRTKVKSTSGYSNPPSFSVFEQELTIEEFTSQTSLSVISEHLKHTDVEPMKLQRIALAMRAVLAGSADPTGFGQSFTPRTGYRGLKSTSFKRQFGMMTTPEALAGEAAQFSTWLSTLLAKLLRWPGIHVNDQGFEWPREYTFKNVSELVNKRLNVLKENYCQSSGMPGLPELVYPDWNESKKSLRVAMVQSKLPFKKDFVTAGTLLDNPDYRYKHRRHVARVAELVVKHIRAQQIDDCKAGEREQDIDLIVWPELSVHQDDMDILVQLSRKTHAIVLAGLGFINQPNVMGPNNCAVWIVPRKHNGNQNEIKRFQGKFHMMEGERELKIQSWRPYQLFIELKQPKFKDKQGFKLTSAICFDATDIKLSADLQDKSNALFIPAMNTDVGSFDTMVEALHYHMYQPVVLVNTGEFGGSYAMAPYKKRHKRLIAHSTGNNQVAINTFDMNMFDFRRDKVGSGMTSGIETKTPPAGVPLKDAK
ncbi:RNA-directed DNA polymerase [Nitrincola tapanii]|uniref:RNA-directed DNA polymerase n=1 Tax=Nitrincola tapanii TaxID=1708751 RepID=A0A5A9WAV4_9GAMM|nr:RNA-directed DNA polymerase [Nitrincola tapanii]KAA0876571.1 RNA-directed DNA polymerase [Nitrincola tapanii]